ncbi:MAG TPA: hypothetical protein VLD86_02100, partial [Ilumatobacteraceae bacterium]|nr:hypothetical protein [Ilumatobacteraceae bacterium]
RRMLEILDDHGLVAERRQAPSQELLDAAHRLAALLSAWSDVDARGLFADNVPLDEPFNRRASRAAEHVAEHGSLAVVEVTASARTRGQATMQHADGTQVKVDVELSPLMPPRIQFYEVSTA